MSMRTRFAPSPTGRLHVGNARTALFSALLAARENGTLILRIEDTDAERSRPEFETKLIEDLDWLGIAWQEGPDKGGKHGPYRQSERGEVYRIYIDKLAEQGLTYPCFCTPTELALARKTQLAAGRPPRYAGTCAHLTADEIETRLAKGLKPALRFRVPEKSETVFDDLIRGRQAFAHRDIGDFVVQRAAGSPAFFFSNAVDDALMGVTHVLRGEDHLTNTPRQLLLLKALVLPIPRYGHLSLIVGEGGAPLSKREGGGSVEELRRDGILPEALLNYLARLGHTYAGNDFMSFAELAEHFDIAHIGHSPAHYDHQQLEHWQQMAIRGAEPSRLWQWLTAVHPQLDAIVSSDKRDVFLELMRENVTRSSEAVLWAHIIFTDEIAYDEAAVTTLEAVHGNFFGQALACFKQLPAEFRPFAKAVGAATGLSGKNLFMPLRAALTGRIHGPEMDRLWPLIPSAHIEQRLRAAGDFSKE
ncbi:MAG: glutamate--tRNA ligase [Gammaproteobacteria bacterium]